MIRFVELVTPQNWVEAVLKGLAFLTLIGLTDLVAVRAIWGRPYGLGDLLKTLAVAGPFVAFTGTILTHLRQLQRRLAWLATTDVLTGLPNRRAFLARAAEATEGGRPGVLFLLDADHFKRINDTWGHAVGDACLAAIGERLRAALRPGDVVGRLGGEEFSIFLPGATREQAQALGERLCRAIAVEAVAGEEALRVTLSIGATLGGGPTPLARLMAQADAALYRAKAEGRARLVFWSEGEDRQDSRAA